MKPIIPEVTRSVIDILENLDADPGKARPVTFWFYSESEGNLYRAADQLQKTGYTIDYCGPAACNDEWLLIVEKVISPEFEEMNRMWESFEAFAGQFGIKYDGWETRIDLG